MAHPARIAILQHIIKQNACICNDLVEELGLAQRQFHTLERAENIGIIKGNIEGTSDVTVLMKQSGMRLRRNSIAFLSRM